MPENRTTAVKSRESAEPFRGVEWVREQMRSLEKVTATRDKTVNDIAGWLRDKKHELVAPLLFAAGSNDGIVSARLADRVKVLGFTSYVNGHYILNERGREVVAALRKHLRSEG